MFVLAEAGGEWRLRMAGAWLEQLHGRARADAPFAELWAEADRPAVRRVLDEVGARATPRVLACRGVTARGGAVELELLLAPTTGPSGGPDRRLGLCQPLSPLAGLDGGSLQELRLATPAVGGRPRLVVDNTRARPLGSAGADVAER